MKLKFEDIVFFIVIGLIVFVVLWLLNGSPTLNSAIVSVGAFVASSEILLWRKLFSIDKNTAISFVKLKNYIKNLDIRLDEIKKGTSDKLSNIEKIVKI